MSSSTFHHGPHALHVTASGQGQPVVFIHGLSGSRGWWRSTWPALAAQARLYTLELSGYGHARRHAPTGVRAHSAVIAAWLDAEDLRDVTLVGHSMGGQISIHVAALRPDRVTQLVLVCASGLLRARAHRTALRLPGAAMIGNRRFLSRVVWDALRAGPRTLWRSATDLLTDSVQDSLTELRARTLIIWGERDVLVPVELGRRLHEALPGSRLEIIAGAGHIVMVDAPETFNALLVSFLRGGHGQ